jgi:hypothetical protein
MKGLRGGIPRALRSHRTPEGAAYGTYCRAKLDRLGPLPKDAMPTLREAGLVILELSRIHRESEAPRLRRRDRARLRRQAVILRSQLVQLEKRLEELAQDGRHAGAESLEGYLARRYNAASDGHGTPAEAESGVPG